MKIKKKFFLLLLDIWVFLRVHRIKIYMIKIVSSRETLSHRLSKLKYGVRISWKKSNNFIIV